jgi:hypothetical protein
MKRGNLQLLRIIRAFTMAFGLPGLFMSVVPQLEAQHYTIDWSKLAGGLGTSTGGVYSVTGTIGQPDPGTMSGGSFKVHGGFWSVLAAVQEPGVPILSITLSVTNTVLVSWQTSAKVWELWQTKDLKSSNWWPVTAASHEVGGRIQAIVPVAAGSRYFRLVNP